MPNTLPPILDHIDLLNYKYSIVDFMRGHEFFVPLMTFKITDKTTPDMVHELKRVNAVAGKLYPEGVTTNSQDGVTNIEALFPVFEAMQECKIVLCLHGEQPGAFCMDRELMFLENVFLIASNFPRLKIVLEHISDRRSIETVIRRGSNVAATITLHHMMLTLDDIVGGSLDPHSFCKPISKRPEDRGALIQAAISGNPQFFLGSDSAPHLIENKQSACGAAGIYSAPVLLPALAELFESQDALDKLEGFTSRHARAFYDLPEYEDTITLVKDSWTVPTELNGVQPFLAGKTISWRQA